mmetsp:Transcript_72030/g.154192  ORF Transcript_72030/g.154192 Transcript_72030/m.154192 type:complete len:205 (+) Transcript_72030:169-783(+)
MCKGSARRTRAPPPGMVAKLTATGGVPKLQPNCRPWKNLATRGTSAADLTLSKAQPMRCPFVIRRLREATQSQRPASFMRASITPGSQSLCDRPRRRKAVLCSFCDARLSQHSSPRRKSWTRRGGPGLACSAFDELRSLEELSETHVEVSDNVALQSSASASASSPAAASLQPWPSLLEASLVGQGLQRSPKAARARAASSVSV